MTLNVVEGAAPGSIIGSVGQVDKPESNALEGQVTYLVVDGTDRDGTFMVDRLKGDVYLVRELDYEKGSSYTLHIEVSDFSKAFPNSYLVKLEILVQDSNDHAPQFSEDPVTIVIPENKEPGASVYTFQAGDQVKTLLKFHSTEASVLFLSLVLFNPTVFYVCRMAVGPIVNYVIPLSTSGLKLLVF